MPQDHLSQEWTDWFIENNTKNGTLLQHDDNFMIATNYRFANKEYDEKYAIPYTDAIVIFPKTGVTTLTDLLPAQQAQLFQYIDMYHAKGYYTYYNSPFDMTIDRFHMHFLFFERHKGKKLDLVTGKRYQEIKT